MYHVVLCHADDTFRGGDKTAAAKAGFQKNLSNCNAFVR